MNGTLIVSLIVIVSIIFCLYHIYKRETKLIKLEEENEKLKGQLNNKS